MLNATEQQLQLISRKTERLEQTVAADVADVKRLRLERDEKVRLVEHLQRQLEDAQRAAHDAIAAHDEATVRLKQNAAEYSKAQILRKRYQNTLDELAGHCKSVVAIADAASQESLVVADECTLNVQTRNKQFVVDAVCPLDDCDAKAAPELLLDGHGFSLRTMISDVLRGHNSTLIAFGPGQSGKTTLFFGDRSSWAAQASTQNSYSSRNGFSASSSRFGSRGPSAGTIGPVPSAVPMHGVVPLFFKEMFDSLEQLEVTHFNMRLSVGELAHDSVNDLLGDYNPAMSAMGSGSHGGEIRLLPFQSYAEAMQLLRNGLQRLNQRRKSHVIVAAVIENFDIRGNFRRATATFVDLAGSLTNVTAQPSQTNPDQLWVNKSLSQLTETISFATSGRHLLDAPHSRSKIVQFLGEALGGNSKTTMICVLNCSKNSSEEMIQHLVHAYHFKAIVNRPVPYDIPAELQRLHAEMDEFE